MAGTAVSTTTTLAIIPNTTPIVPVVGNIGWATADGDGGTAGPIKTGNTAKNGSGAINKIFTAGANGSILNRLRFNPVGAQDGTVLRVFILNASGSPGVNDYILWREIPLPAITSGDMATPQDRFENVHMLIPPGYRIVVTINDTLPYGWRVMAEGADF